MEMLKIFNYIIAVAFTLCYAYQIIYVIAPFILKDKKYATEKQNRYAVLICARNEELVIANLIDSINNQSYNKDLITTFVVADNCTDETALKALQAGAVVYERENKSKVGKGYAMQFLLNCIKKDYKQKFDGYFVFDADNLLSVDYISEMNKTFSEGFNIVTSYRNSKNFDTNWITSGYSLWFLREAKYLNNSRMLLETSCAVSGTGFLFSDEILQKCGGWNFFLLTEDIEFTVYNILNRERIGYCGSAIFYDEQPETFRQSWTQRLRWARGIFQVFKKYGLSLIKGMVTHSFACFDMTMSIMPAVALTIISFFVNLGAIAIGIITETNIDILIFSLLETAVRGYAMFFAVGLITIITEWKNIYGKSSKKIASVFTFPIFMATYIPISAIALFKNVQWQQIKHVKAKTLANIANN